MKTNFPLLTLILFGFLFLANSTSAQDGSFPWPEGKKMAISLTFDDARSTNPTLGAPLLDEYGIKATFYVVPNNMKTNLDAWKRVVASGHEIGNHSQLHPCSGNFAWTREKALENYTLDRMEKELVQTNADIKALLGVEPTSFAYPCGQTYVGKGQYTQSYVPLVSKLFVSGRGWLDEGPSDPMYVDMAQLTGMEMDGKSFEQVLALIESASKQGLWLVLAGHETNESGNQTTQLSMLRKLAEYVNDPKNGIWVAPVGTIAAHVVKTRDSLVHHRNMPQLVRADANGVLSLTAENGKGIGPDIKYMPEWHAFGWFTAKDSVVWEIAPERGGTYEVWLDWSVSDKEAGKEFVLEIGQERIVGKVEKSGSWETFQHKSIGKVSLNPGYAKLVFKSAENFEQGALLDLKEIRLVPTPSLE